jgi:HK97 family phage portal protein
MSLSKRIKAAEQKRTNNSQWVEPLIPGRPAYMAPSGIDVNADSAIRMSTVYACVRLLGDTISSLPLAAYVRRGRNRISYASVYGSQPAWINKPNPEASRLEFYEQIIASLNIHGNAFILTVRDDMDEVQEVYCVHPDDVRIERPRPGEPIIYKMRDEDGIYSRILTSREMKHIPLFRLPGSLYGLGPIAAARLTIGAAMAADTYAAAYFGNAANPGGVIEVPGELTEEQAGDIGRDWNITHTGPYRAGKIGILSGGAQFRPLTLNAADAQLLEARRFNVEDIARLFRVPISLLGHPVAGAMSFASVEAQNLSFVQHSLRPLLERIEQSMSELLPEPDGFIKFNLDALLRGTTLERFDAYTKGLREGFLSLNDVRAVEDLAPLGEAGDQFRVPLQNIDAADAPDVGLKLRAEIASMLIQVGFDPKAVTEAIGLPAMTHTGLPSTQLQQISTIDPADPQSVYEVNAREARNDEPSIVIQVPESNINVEPTNINVQPPNITFETPNVDVQVAAPNVNVESPTIEVTNTIEQKSVRRKVIRDENNLITEIIEEFVKDEE